MRSLSIIVPNYQTEQNLFLSCLNSIISRCDNTIEIIVIDDGSSETYRENVYGNSIFIDERVRLIFQENGGVSSARNRGISEAKGKYIAFVDADDVILGDFIEESLYAAEVSQADMVIGGLVDLGEFPNVVNNSYSNSISRDNIKIINQRNELINLLLGVPVRLSDRIGYIGRGPVAKIIRSEIAKQVSFQEGLAIYEDTLWNMNLVKLVNSTCVVDCIWYGYHNTVQSASKGFHSDEIERSTNGMNAIAEVLDFSDRIVCQAFREQCIVEYLRIVNTYFLSSQHDSKKISAMKESKRLLHTRPWNMVSTLRDLQGFPHKMKLYGVIYILNAWIPVKRILKAFKYKHS